MTTPTIAAIVAAYGPQDDWEAAQIAKAAEMDRAVIDLCRTMRDQAQTPENQASLLQGAIALDRGSRLTIAAVERRRGRAARKSAESKAAENKAIENKARAAPAPTAGVALQPTVPAQPTSAARPDTDGPPPVTPPPVTTPLVTPRAARRPGAPVLAAEKSAVWNRFYAQQDPRTDVDGRPRPRAPDLVAP